MVPLSQFDKIIYNRPRLYRFEKPLEKIIGLDSEAYTTGETFMFTTSLGDVIAPEDLIETLFTPKYAGANFVTWNLKYESGAILKIFPRKNIKELQLTHTTTFIYKDKKYRISYIPHKRLAIRHMTFHGQSIRFWDMSPFYGRLKLDTAAKEYLDSSKHDIDPNLFTLSYVKENYEKIASYCVQDSILTQRLAALWIDKFQQTGIAVTSLYSEASISFTYISKKATIVTPWDYWEHNKKFLRMAFESYEGGKFEVLTRGRFTGYEFDISSAYPFEIANLIDIRKARLLYDSRYHPEAFYGFLRVRICVSSPDIYLPCGIFKKLRIYPMGEYFLTITKQEYDYIVLELKSPHVSVEILEASWLTCRRKSYPYKAVMQELYGLKTEWKSKDRLRSNNYKIIMNGFYGKMAQCIYSEDSYRAGLGWNPVYASVITANTRISVTRLQNILKSSALAVHTDSVISTVPIPKKFLGNGLGKYELVEQGEGVIVACGIYEINGQCALKGFRKYSISSLLKENPHTYKISLTVKHVESWLQSMSQNHDVKDINVFKDVEKILKLNCDTKRIWEHDLSSTEFLTTTQKSQPLIEYQKNIPEFWK